VTQSDGIAAVGYTVRLEVADAANQKRIKRGSAKTDAEGYFRIDLRANPDTNPKDVSVLERWVERFARTLPIEGGGVEFGREAEATRNASTGASATSAVRVLDSRERIVFEDPAPPIFDDGISEFRYYVLGSQGNASAVPKT
jgi:hypothetical protein